MHLKDLQRHWHEFGRRDPLWAILTLPGKRNAGWDTAEFFQTGRDEIAQALAHLARLGVPRPRRRALDFGCGVGRLTQALCEQIGAACGVDIAPSMIEQARQYNRYGTRCEYVLNDAADLRGFADESFDFVYSTRVLQHMRPEYSTRYLRELLRVLARGGAAVFQIPIAPPPLAASGLPSPDSIAAHALPANAYRARLTPSVPALSGLPGMALAIRVEVRNASPLPWPCRRLAATPHPIKVGNHWRDADGALLTLDDGRTMLTEDLAPDGAVTLPLTVNAPSEPGEYRLELDLVHDWVTWFADRQSPISGIPVSVRAPVTARLHVLARKVGTWMGGAGGAPVVSPVMEMYRLPDATVAEVVAAADATIADRVPDQLGGVDWSGFTYYVLKPGAEGRC